MAESKNEQEAEQETPIQDTARKDVETPENDTNTPLSSHGKRWLLLLLIMVSLLLLGWFLSSQNMRQQWIDIVINHMPPQAINKMNHSSEPASSSVISIPVPAMHVSSGNIETVPQPPKLSPVVPEPVPSFQNNSAHPAATSKEINVLIATIHDLQNKVESLQGKQADLTALRRALDARQRLELRARLRWIANPQASLSQMASFWQDITLLPMLSENKQREAGSMRQLAAEDAGHLKLWSKKLKQLAAALPVPIHQDIIPKPENPVFSWLTGRIHLRPAPTPEQQAASQFRARLLNTAHALTLEVWPTHRAWRRLLADLRERFGDDADLALPEHLDGIQKDITRMRKTATVWLGQ